MTHQEHRTAMIPDTEVPPTQPMMAVQPGDVWDVLHRILACRKVPMAYQPILALDTLGVVGFEALARPQLLGPAGSGPSVPEVLAAARAIGRLAEVDWICRASAFVR